MYCYFAVGWPSVFWRALIVTGTWELALSTKTCKKGHGVLQPLLWCLLLVSSPYISRLTFFLTLLLQIAFRKSCFFLTLVSLASSSWAFTFLFLCQSAQAMLLFSSCLAYLYLHLCAPFLYFQFIKTLLLSQAGALPERWTQDRG